MTSRKEILEILAGADAPMSTREIAEISYSKDPRGCIGTRIGKVYQHLHKMYEEEIVDEEIRCFKAAANRVAYWSLRGAA